MSSGVPSATTLPAFFAASGPDSITQSALLITSRLCSTTNTVFPRETSLMKHVEQLANVLEGNPVVAHRGCTMCVRWLRFESSFASLIRCGLAA